MSEAIDNAVEEWKAIPGFEGVYSVSNLGRIRREKYSNLSSACRNHEGILKPFKDPKGYLRVDLGSGINKCRRKVHRIVACAFIDNPLVKPEVNHKNGIKNDNRSVNLEWATTKENCTHSFSELGRQNLKGESQGCSKLRNEDVPKIRNLLNSGMNCCHVSKLYGVSPAAIWYIKQGKHWNHIN